MDEYYIERYESGSEDPFEETDNESDYRLNVDLAAIQPYSLDPRKDTGQLSMPTVDYLYIQYAVNPILTSNIVDNVVTQLV